MTRDEMLDVLAFVAGRRPNSNLGSPTEAVVLWLDALGRYDRDEVETAVRRLLAAGGEWAPNADQVAQEIEQARQGPPPSFDELQAFLSRNVRLLPYGQTNTPADTVTSIEQLSEAGAHEAVLRFIAAQGVFAVRMTPHGALEKLDPNQLADRRDMARDYQQRVLPAWRSDPRPGLALAQAQRQLDASQRGHLRQTEAAAMLPRPEMEGDPA